jgi:glycosyltransferase involved in cell wall biosynthesis
MLSVIITTYEQSKSLGLLLQSLKVQDVRVPFEILICDDGSSMITHEVVSKPMFADLDIRYLWQPDRGHRTSRSKNNGIRCAKGDILVFLDADILVNRDFLRKHAEAHVARRSLVCNPRRWVMNQDVLQAQRCERESVGACSFEKDYGLQGYDISRVFEVQWNGSVEVERDYQRAVSLCTATAWLSCMGFSFSVTRETEVLFDETFEGWGPEDREFALRLVR